tara:strand:- start:9663 stop:10667 length:1005 start_codon:yes stop_codon:yes gene_type:complete
MKTIIIAEIGVNHNGKLALAKEMISAASLAGADIVKFQTYNAEDLVLKTSSKANYQLKNSRKKETQYIMLKNLQLSKNDHFLLIKHCKKFNIEFLSTGFDLKSLKFLSSIDLPYYKIPSGEITNVPYLRFVAKENKPIILSTGMSYLSEVKFALEQLIIHGANKEDITVLHCNTAYPTKMYDVNLNAMNTLKDKLDINVGYSDHTIGVEVPIAAVSLGAKIIEKHLTLDRNMKGPDHAASMEPDEFKEMVRLIRNVEIALGSNEKTPSPSERENINHARKSIVANTEIKKGDTFTDLNLTTKRPGSGISPVNWDSFIGKQSTKNYKKNQQIEEW